MKITHRIEPLKFIVGNKYHFNEIPIGSVFRVYDPRYMREEKGYWTKICSKTFDLTSHVRSNDCGNIHYSHSYIIYDGRISLDNYPMYRAYKP